MNLDVTLHDFMNLNVRVWPPDYLLYARKEKKSMEVHREHIEPFHHASAIFFMQMLHVSSNVRVSS